MPSPVFKRLSDAAAWYDGWLRRDALPLWAGAGVAASGAFHDALTAERAADGAPRRARVQARQAFVYARAASAGIEGPWRAVAEQGFAEFVARFRRPDSLFVGRVDLHGRVIDESCAIYDQAFALLAMAALRDAGAQGLDYAEEANRTRQALAPSRHLAGGFREAGAHPFQANAHMHLLESALAWEAAGGEDWARLSDEIVALALARFIDSTGGFLREFFDEDWRPAPGPDGRLVEPGHQFEWAWLLRLWAGRRGDAAAASVAQRLFEQGLRGVDRDRGVAVNGLSDDFAVRDGSARLWPQTEFMKAAILFGDEAAALTAAGSLAKYLSGPIRGAWRDRMRLDGSFVDEPAPASSLYHLWMAISELTGRPSLSSPA